MKQRLLVTFSIITSLIFIVNFSVFSLEEALWQEVLSFGYRDEGNAAERQLTSWLLEFAQARNIQAIKRDLSNISGGMHSFGSNIDLYFPGENSGEFVFLIPQSHYDASLLIGLTLADYLSQQSSLPYTVRIIFLSGEQSPNSLVASSDERKLIYPIGSRQMLRLSTISLDSYLFYYQLKSPVHHYRIARDQYLRSPYTLVELLTTIGRQHQWQLELPHSNVVPRRINRSYAWAVDEYLDNDYFAIAISNHQEASSSITIQQTLAWAMDHVKIFWSELSQIEKLEADRELNYIILGHRIIREHHYVFWLIFILFLFLILAAIRRHELRMQWRYLKRNGKSIWLLLPLAFIALFLASFITYSANYYRGEVEFWQHMPLVFASYKVLWTLLLSALLGRLFEGLNFGTKTRFYTVATLFLTIVALLFFAVISIIYTLAWLWFLFFFSLYSLTKWLWLKTLSALLAPAMILYFAADLFFQHSAQQASLLLFSSIEGNILLLLLFAPVFMLTMSLLQYRKVARRYKVSPFASLVVYTLALIANYLLIVYYDPYKRSIEQEPVWFLAQEHAQTRFSQSSARIWGIQRLGDLALYDGRTSDRLLTLSQVPTLMVTDMVLPKMLAYDFDITIRFEEVINRNLTIIEIDNINNVEYLDLTINSARALGVIESNVPITTQDQNNIHIMLGKNPPEKLVIRLISNNPSRLDVRAVASYNFTPHLILNRKNSYLHAGYVHLHKEVSEFSFSI